VTGGTFYWENGKRENKANQLNSKQMEEAALLKANKRTRG